MGKAKVNLAKFKVTWVQGPSGQGKGYKGGSKLCMELLGYVHIVNGCNVCSKTYMH